MPPGLNLVALLAKYQAEGPLEDFLSCYAGPKLLIINELGYLPFEKNAANLFFQLVSRRYECTATMIMTNRSVGVGARSSGMSLWLPRSRIGCFITGW
jgi:DNA replication protein DnaC